MSGEQENIEPVVAEVGPGRVTLDFPPPEFVSFPWVRSAFRELMLHTSAPYHVGYVESWHLAIAWLDADANTKLIVATSLQAELKSFREARKGGAS